MKQFSSLLVAVALFTATVFAADASGTSTGQMPTRDGDTRDVTFKLKDVTFKLKQDGAGFNGSSFKIMFKGTEMTREREGSGNKQNFPVKRSS